MGKNIAKNISKSSTGKYSQRLLDHAKQSATDVFKTDSKRAIQETAEATDDVIGNKIANKIKKVPQNLRKNNSETVTNEHGEQIPNERYVSLQERKNIIDDLRLIMNITMIMEYNNQRNNGISKNNKFVRQYTKSTI